MSIRLTARIAVCTLVLIGLACSGTAGLGTSWRVDLLHDPMDDTDFADATLPGENGHLRLVVRCVAGKSSVRLEPARANAFDFAGHGDELAVRIRLDDANPAEVVTHRVGDRRDAVLFSEPDILPHLATAQKVVIAVPLRLGDDDLDIFYPANERQRFLDMMATNQCVLY